MNDKIREIFTTILPICNGPIGNEIQINNVDPSFIDKLIESPGLNVESAGSARIVKLAGNTIIFNLKKESKYIPMDDLDD